MLADLDTQVPLEQNLSAMETALDNAITTDYEIIVLENTNHLFQPDAVTGSPEEYATLELKFTTELIDILLEWLHAHVDVS